MDSSGTKRFFVYWIRSGTSSYIGATVDPQKRLRQHCGVIQGGAKRTRGKLWTFECVISGFRTWHEALCFEWSFKYHSKRCRSVESRTQVLREVSQKERWTRNSPLSVEVPLVFEFQPIQYGLPPEHLPPKLQTHSSVAKQVKKKRKKGNFKALYGVKY